MKYLLFTAYLKSHPILEISNGLDTKLYYMKFIISLNESLIN